MNYYAPKAGEDIYQCARAMFEMAQRVNDVVEAEHGGVLFLSRPEDSSPQEAIERWTAIVGASAFLRMNDVDPRNAVLWFAQRMELVLRAHDHKGGWKTCTMKYLTDRLREEQVELEWALSGLGPSPTVDNVAKIVREATDVANFAMMIAGNVAMSVGLGPMPNDEDSSGY